MSNSNTLNYSYFCFTMESHYECVIKVKDRQARDTQLKLLQCTLPLANRQAKCWWSSTRVSTDGQRIYIWVGYNYKTKMSRNERWLSLKYLEVDGGVVGCFMSQSALCLYYLLALPFCSHLCTWYPYTSLAPVVDGNIWTASAYTYCRHCEDGLNCSWHKQLCYNCLGF